MVIIPTLTVLVLLVGLFIFLANSNKSIFAKNTEIEQNDIESNKQSEARKKLENLSDEEIKELIHRFHEANEGGKKITKQEYSILNTLTPTEYYDIIGMTEDEIYNLFDVLLVNVNSFIITAHEDGSDGVNYNKFKKNVTNLKEDFEWIVNNHDFEKEYHKEMVKYLLELMDSYDNGDNDALFSLKYVLHEINREFNPEIFDRNTAVDVTLSNAVRIQNGQEPIRADK